MSGETWSRTLGCSAVAAAAPRRAVAALDLAALVAPNRAERVKGSLEEEDPPSLSSSALPLLLMKRRLEAVSREMLEAAAAAEEGTGPAADDDATGDASLGRAPDSRRVKAFATERVAKTATLALLSQCMVEIRAM